MRLHANTHAKQRQMRWTLIGALLLALTACASQTSGAHGPSSSPTTYPTLEPWIPTLTPTNVPYSTAVPGTMPHVDGLLYVHYNGWRCPGNQSGDGRNEVERQRGNQR